MKSPEEADAIVTQMTRGPMIEKVYVFAGAHFDEMKAPLGYSKGPPCGSWSQKKSTYSGEPLQRVLSMRPGKR